MNIEKILKPFHINHSFYQYFYKIDNIYIYYNHYNYVLSPVILNNDLSCGEKEIMYARDEWCKVFPELIDKEVYIYSEFDLKLIINKLLRIEKLNRL